MILTHNKRIRVTRGLAFENGQNHSKHYCKEGQPNDEHNSALPNVTFPLARLNEEDHPKRDGCIY